MTDEENTIQYAEFCRSVTKQILDQNRVILEQNFLILRSIQAFRMVADTTDWGEVLKTKDPT